MCPPIPPDVAQVIEGLGLPERFSTPLASYSAKLIENWAPQCIILYGSLARSTYTNTSDIDLVVVSQRLPENFLDRLATLQELNDTRCSIDAFGYTPEEFQGMLRRGRVTALDALADGIPLYGSSYFDQLREVFEDMVRQGLRRSVCTWVLPRPVSSS
jgi:predicted nucleotidyltransferase